MKYFATLNTVEEIKNVYRMLAMKHHPDKGGDTATMQVINAQYHEALKRCDGQTSVGDNGQEHRYTYDADIEQAVMDKLSEIVRIASDDWKVMLIGRWIWIGGTDKTDKDRLNKNGAGCLWHSGKSLWYWRPKDAKSWSRGKGNLNSMAYRYGYREFTADRSRTLN